jgi:hypothetical protein
MPGGKITAKQELPDLQSYLARKRYPLDKWLVANNITSTEALNSLISSNKWIVSPELHHLISELLKPIYIPPAPIVEAVVSAPVVVEPIETVLKEETVVEQVVEQQTNLATEEQVVSSEPEENIQIVEESSMVPYQSFKERKKSR